jgi:glycerate 2-kinase
VGNAARAAGRPCFAFAGTIGDGAEMVLEHGVSAIFSICPRPIPMHQAVEHAGELLEFATEQAVRAFLAGRG